MTTDRTPIRSFVKNLLNSDSNLAGVGCWEEQVRGAASRTEWLRRLIQTPRGIDLFTRLGEVANGRPSLKVYARRFGTDLGTIYLRRNDRPTFRLKTPDINSPLNHTFEAVRRELSSPEDWQKLMRGCEWDAPALRSFFAAIVRQPLEGALDRVKEQPLEDALIRSLRNDLFWFDGCQLAEDQNPGQAFPFKFRLPIRVEQGESKAIRDGSWQKLILEPGTTSVSESKRRASYGAPDVMVRSHGCFGRNRRRLGILELKQPGSGKAKMALLQGYAYAVAIAELQQRCLADRVLNKAFRNMLGYTGAKPCPIPMSAYAVVHQKDVLKVREGNPLTTAVLEECGNEVLVGILGYELDNNAIRLTSAVQWVGDKWESFLETAPAGRRTVSLVR